MNIIKRILRKIFGKTYTNRLILKEWKKAGKPVPPPHLVKQQIISNIRKKFGYNLLIETGTYLGEMVIAQKKNFKRIISIELGELLYLDAVKKFKQDKNIEIINGDSGEVLVKIANEINEPAIFWLDGHYSAGITAKGKKMCPIYEELSAIFNALPFNHALLIDDARLFIGKEDYPTIPELETFIKEHRPQANIYCKNDIIHVFI